ncbi:MAG: hypothetical protein WCP14_04515 [bacterium]
MKDLLFYNGYGGFDPENYDYVINNYKTPTPWCNIIANSNFGTLVTQSGAMHTWYGNSSLFRLTPKIDDPVIEKSGEKIFLKNETSSKVWQPLNKASEIRHSRGYSTFRQENDLDSEITVFVTAKKPIKIVELRLRNNLEHSATFSATYYLQPVLGEFLEKTKVDIRTSYDAKSKKLFVKNPGSFYYPDALAYLGTSEKSISYSLDRSDFLGRNSETVPRGLLSKTLPSKNAPANDPAMIIKTDFVLKKNEEKTIYFYLGIVARDGSEGYETISESTINPTAELEIIKEYWKGLPTFEIDTPDKELNIMMNKWLLYQVVSSRLWGKTGFWQPGGAFGYRDQLQDVMSLVWTEPENVRSHILLAASRQFNAGDVQHWWHPPRGDGVRTTSSDAALWLVYALDFYLDVTGDENILDEKVSYLQSGGHDIHPGAYFVPEPTVEKDTIYNHCVTAIDRSLYLIGEHGLPLILNGDWNDSLSNIGANKRGESVWLGQFLTRILKDFVHVCEKRQDFKRAAVYSEALEKLENNLEKTWDGKWYKRAYWDDGTVLGTCADKFCRIDGLAQNWSVISGVGSKSRMLTAMDSVEKNLIDWKRGEVRLLTPPFSPVLDKNPGYIVTYPEGTRENGSTYSHNATWSAVAFSLLGEGNKAGAILDLLNPIHRTNTKSKVDLYQGEPYVMASDIYTEGTFRGHAGWTWYTGSASAYYRTVIENILGIKIRNNVMTFEPCIPVSWKKFSVVYLHGHTKYIIEYDNSRKVESGVKKVVVGDSVVTEILLTDDKKEHVIKVFMG